MTWYRVQFWVAAEPEELDVDAGWEAAAAAARLLVPGDHRYVDDVRIYQAGHVPTEDEVLVRRNPSFVQWAILILLVAAATAVLIALASAW